MGPNCDATDKVGGVNKTVYAGQKDNFTINYDSDGYVNSISPKLIGSIPAKLYKFTGKRDKNNWTSPMVPGENVNTFNHTALLQLYYSTPTELDTIKKLANADDVFIVMQGNDGKFVVLGAENGLNGSAGEGGSGTLLNDSTAYSLTLSGEQMSMPAYFRTGSNPSNDLATNLAALDAIASY